MIKQIEKFPDYYVSDQGGVFRDWHGKLKQLKSVLRKDGYLQVGLYGKKIFLVHRLIAEAFITNPNNFQIVNHLNGNKADNRVENLEWTTQLGNIQHYLNTLLPQRNPEKYERINENDVNKLREEYINAVDRKERWRNYKRYYHALHRQEILEKRRKNTY